MQQPMDEGDLTDRKRAEAATQFLSEATDVLLQSLDYETALRDVTRLAVPQLADWCAVYVPERDGTIRSLAVAHVNTKKVELAWRFLERHPVAADAPGGPGAVIRTGRAELTPELTDAMLRAGVPDGESLAILRALGLRSMVCAPMIARGRVLAAVVFISAESGRRYDELDLALANDLARRAALAVDNALLYRDAQDALRARENFVAVASHDLKTPISALTLQLEHMRRLAGRGALSDPAVLTAKISAAERNVARLYALVQGLLDVTAISAGRLSLELDDVDLAATTAETLQRAHEDLARSRCLMVFRATEPIMGRWDRLRLEQIVDNLVSNAMKYAPGKPIEVTVTGSENEATLTVRDHGPGVSEENRARIFERFERAPRDTHTAGSGLGLWIVRQIVQALGGEISLSGAVGEGSTFTVTLPRKG